MATKLKAFMDMTKTAGYLILDIETTGLKNAEVCEIAIIKHTGEILLDTLVKPTKPIPKAAWSVHGISDGRVAEAPGWEQVSDDVRDILSAHDNLIVYNAKFDRHMMYSSDEHIGVDHVAWKELISCHCAMEAYAEYFGEWNEYQQSYRWQRLGAAARQMQITANNLHSALADCQTTLAIVQAMAIAK